MICNAWAKQQQWDENRSSQLRNFDFKCSVLLYPHVPAPISEVGYYHNSTSKLRKLALNPQESPRNSDGGREFQRGSSTSPFRCPNLNCCFSLLKKADTWPEKYINKYHSSSTINAITSEPHQLFAFRSAMWPNLRQFPLFIFRNTLWNEVACIPIWILPSHASMSLLPLHIIISQLEHFFLWTSCWRDDSWSLRVPSGQKSTLFPVYLYRNWSNSVETFTTSVTSIAHPYAELTASDFIFIMMRKHKGNNFCPRL